jgi:hypothetical protein
MLLVVMSAAIATFAIAGTAASAAVPDAGALAQTASTTARVVVIAVPDLRWSDLAAMPRLARYAQTSSVGDLSVRAEPAASRCADGALTFAAGNRADAGGQTGCAVSRSRRAALLTSLRRDRYGGDIAALGDALRDANVSTGAVGPGANLLLADAADQVGVLTSNLTVALDRAEVVAVVDDALYVAPPAARVAAARGLDRQLAAQLAAVPPGATTIVAGSSDAPTGGPHLHVVLVHGPGWRHVELSSSTKNASVVQLIDLAPTVLATLRLPTPASMIGRAVFDTSRRAPSAAAFVDAQRHDLASRRLDGSVRTAFALAGILVLALVVAAWRWGNRRLHHAAVAVSRWGIGLPIATYLLQIVPWWRVNLGWYPVMLGAVMLALGGLTTAAAVRRGAAAAVVAVPVVVVVVLGVDQLLGGALQASAPLGNLSLVAGRLHGIGNIAFACLCPAALLCAGVAGGQLIERDRRRGGLVVAAAICAVAALIDAAPQWGDDFGGVLAMTPAAVLLLAVLADVQVTARRIAGSVVGVVAVAVALAAADYSRPAADQTHIGRFAGEVLHGGAGRTIWRKLDSDLHSFGNVPVTGSVVLLIVVWVLWRRQVAAILRRVAGVRAAAVAVALLALVGTALNDSGVVIAQFALVLGLLAVVGAGLAEPEEKGGRPS